MNLPNLNDGGFVIDHHNQVQYDKLVIVLAKLAQERRKRIKEFLNEK